MLGRNAGIATVKKYSTNGKQLWVARYDDYFASALGVDSAGNIYATGVNSSSGDLSNWLTLKYAPNGNLISAAKNPQPGGGTSLAADIRSDLYVAGGFPVNGQEQVFAAKYDGAGSLLWQILEPVVISGGSPPRVVFDGFGNVYVATSAVVPSGGNEFFVAKYSQNWIVPVANDGYVVQLPAAPGQKNRIQSTTDLKNWIDIGTNAVLFTGVIQFQDTTAAGVPYRFYRVLPLP